MFARLTSYLTSTLYIVIALFVLFRSADGQLTRENPYYSLTQSYFNLQHQALTGTFTYTKAAVLANVNSSGDPINSVNLTAFGDWTYRVPRQAGFGKVTFSAFLPLSVGNHPVEAFQFGRVVDTRLINGGGSDTDFLAMTVASSDLFLYERFEPENPDAPEQTIEVLSVIDHEPVALLTGNGFDTVQDDLIRRVDSYVLAANTDYLLELRVTTDIINHSFLPDYPTRLVTTEFGGDISPLGIGGYISSFNWQTLPEPSTCILATAAAGAAGMARWRRRARQ